MLTGTLVTVASFIPIGLNSSNAGEFTFTLFVVIAVSLLLSWIVAVLFTPLLGVTLLPKTMKKHHDEPGRLAPMFSARARRRHALALADHRRDGRRCSASRSSACSSSQQQFFPSSDRTELLVDFTLPQNASIAETKAQMDRFEATLAGDPDIDHWSLLCRPGRGAVRALASTLSRRTRTYGQIVIVTKSIEARERLRAQAQGRWRGRNSSASTCYVELLAVGSAGRTAGAVPRQRARHPEGAGARAATRGAGRRRIRCVSDIGFNWNEPARVVKVDVLQDKARQLGVTSAGHRQRAQQHRRRHDHHPGARRHLSGQRRGRARAPPSGGSIETLQNLQLPGQNGQSIPLAAVATFHYELEQPIVWRRDRLPTITVQGQHRRRDPAGDGRPAARSRRCSEFVRSAAGRLSRRGRRPGRGERQVPGTDRRGRAADAVHHGDDPDDPAAELLSGCSWSWRWPRSA